MKQLLMKFIQSLFHLERKLFTEKRKLFPDLCLRNKFGNNERARDDLRGEASIKFALHFAQLLFVICRSDSQTVIIIVESMFDGEEK